MAPVPLMGLPVRAGCRRGDGRCHRRLRPHPMQRRRALARTAPRAARKLAPSLAGGNADRHRRRHRDRQVARHVRVAPTDHPARVHHRSDRDSARLLRRSRTPRQRLAARGRNHPTPQLATGGDRRAARPAARHGGFRVPPPTRRLHRDGDAYLAARCTCRVRTIGDAIRRDALHAWTGITIPLGVLAVEGARTSALPVCHAPV